MIDLMDELIDRMRQQEHELEKLSREEQTDLRDAAFYMGGIEEISRTIQRLIAERYTKKADEIYNKARNLYVNILADEIRKRKG